MATAANAKIQYEAGATLNAYAAMTDSGDHAVFTIAARTIFSGYTGQTPLVRPNGVTSGRNLLSVHADSDKVTVAGFKAYLAGSEVTVSATTCTFTRPTTAGKAKIYSVTIASNSSLVAVAGTISASLVFSETRNAAGGPPLIPTTSVELGQVRVTASTAAAVTAAEIYQVVGQHAEYANYPSYTVNNIGDGENASTAAKKTAYVEFASALPLIHTGGVAKSVYLQSYTPVMADIGKALEFVPAEQSHSTSSTQYYNGIDAAVSSSLGQASFNVRADDGVTDGLISRKDGILTVKFYPDRNKAAYLLSQGKLGVSRTFPVGDQVQIACTLSCETRTVEFSS
jgi:hypothetical protein